MDLFPNLGQIKVVYKGLGTVGETKTFLNELTLSALGKART